MFKAHYISIIYLLAALIFGAFAFLEQSEVLDIALHELYFSIPKSIAWLVLAFLFLVFAGISLAFELSRKPINPYFFGTHFLLTIIGLAVFYFALPQEVSPEPYKDLSVTEELTEDTINTASWAPFMVYLLIGAQLVFGLNVLLSLFKRKRKHRTNL